MLGALTLKSYNFLTQSPFFMIDLSKDSLDVALQLSVTFFSSVEEKFLNFSRKVKKIRKICDFSRKFQTFLTKKKKKVTESCRATSKESFERSIIKNGLCVKKL